MSNEKLHVYSLKNSDVDREAKIRAINNYIEIQRRKAISKRMYKGIDENQTFTEEFFEGLDIAKI